MGDEMDVNTVLKGMEERGELYFDPTQQKAFRPTHRHVKTARLYMLTADGARLEVTGDEAYPLAEYENEWGEKFAQRSDRFHDGRFEVL